MFDLASGLIALGAISGLAVVAWVVSVKKGDVSIVDGLWPVFIWVAGLVYACTAPLMPLAGWPWHCSRSGRRASASTSPCVITASPKTGATRRSVQTISPVSVEESLPRVPAAGSPRVDCRSAVDGHRAAHPASACWTRPRSVLVSFGILFEALADWQLVRFMARPDTGGVFSTRGCGVTRAILTISESVAHGGASACSASAPVHGGVLRARYS